MQKKSLSINAVLNGIKSVLAIVFPLISFPYVSRVLQVDNLGKYNFAYSVVSYFILIAGLGISTYGIREGARYRDNNAHFTRFASELFSINVISTIVSYLLLLLTIAFIPKVTEYSLLIWIFSIHIIFTTIGVEWIYSVFEDYAYITKRSIVVQIVSLLLLFLFVKKEDDYYIYAVITVIANAGANVFNFINSRKYCKLRLTLNIEWRKHIQPILLIFSTSVATTIYVNSDTTILGFLTNDYYVGIYAVSVKIYKIVKTLLSAILIVSVPRLSNYLGKGDIDSFNQLFSKIFKSTFAIVAPAVVGLFLVAEEVVIVISGAEYIKAVSSLRILSLALLVCLFGWLFNACILIPYKKEGKVLIATLGSALINVVLNFVLIPIYQENAAAFTTLIAEMCSMVICLYFSKDFIQLRNIKIAIWNSLIGCVGILLVCSIIKLFDIPVLPRLILSMTFSAVVYFFTFILLKDQMAKEALGIIINKLSHR